MKTKKEELKRLFEKKKKISLINKELSLKLDKEIEKYLGFEPEFDKMDFLVDTINAGIGDLSFKEFIIELDKIKRNLTEEEIDEDIILNALDKVGISETKEKGLCKCGHFESYHNLGNTKLTSGCNYVVDDDGESYGLCDCKKYEEEISSDYETRETPIGVSEEGK